MQAIERKSFIPFLVLLFSLSGIPGKGQILFQTTGEDYIISVQYHSMDDGLIYREAISNFQDSRNFLWFGTKYGLSRFDGTEYKSWTLEDLSAEYRIAILGEDSEGYLWLDASSTSITKDRIILLHTLTGEVIPLEDRFPDSVYPSNRIIKRPAVQTADKTLYFLSGSGDSLYSYHHLRGFSASPIQGGVDLFFPVAASPDSYYAGKSKEKLSTFFLSDTLMEIDLQGNVRKVFRIDGSVAGHFFFEWQGVNWFYERPAPGTIGSFHRIGADHQLETYSPEDLGFPDDFFEKEDNGLLYIDHHQESDLLLAVRYGKVLLLNPETGENLNLSAVFPVMEEDDVIGNRGCLKDRNGTYWLSGDFGIYQIQIQKSPFRVFHAERSETGRRVQKGISCRQIFRYQGRLMLVSDNTGLIPLEGTAGPVWDESYFCTSGCVTTNGSLFIGGFPHLYGRFAGTSELVQIPTESEGGEMHFLFIKETEQDKLLVGGNFGLRELDLSDGILREFSGYNQYDQVRNITFYDAIPFTDGQWGLCTHVGIYIYDPDKGIVGDFTDLPIQSVNHFYEDEEGVIWLATNGNGLLRWDRRSGTVRAFTNSVGLSSNIIYAVYEDDYGFLWLPSDNGIIQFDKKTATTRFFLPEDGVSHQEFNRNSHFQGEDGTLYFGTLNGVTSFHPGDFIQSDTVADIPLELTESLLFDGSENQLMDITRKVLETGTIVVNPGDRYFSVRFALLNYLNTDKVRYSWKLDGFGEQWTEQQSNYLQFGGLHYGDQILHIRAKAPNGVWSQNEILITIRVLKPVYLRTWFLLLAGLLIVGITYGIYRYHLKRNSAIQESRRLKDLDSLKSGLYTNISHEFRTPLTVILGLTENLMQSSKAKVAKSQISSDLEEKLNRIFRNGRNLLGLVNQLLDLSKLDAKAIQLTKRQMDIVPYLNYLVESFYSAAMEKDIRLVLDKEVDQLIMDYDEVRIQQIVYNLLSNALKFTGPKGQVIVRINRIEDQGKTFAKISVKDSGIGIPAESQPHIFDRFFQVAGNQPEVLDEQRDFPERSKAIEGTGIGLALTKELVELMDGTIRLESRPGSGTVFEVLLPVTNESPPGNFSGTSNSMEGILSAEAGTTNPESDQPVLLIIEDNLDVAYFIRDCLGAEYQVVHAQDGDSGLSQAFDLIPDIVITDVMMPGPDGYEVTRRLKADERTSHIPVIILTAKARSEDRISGLKEGADAYLTKPFIREELLVRVRNMTTLRKKLQDRYSGFHLSVPTSKTVTTLEDLFMEKIRQAIEKHLGDSNLNADILCREVQLSQAQLYRKLKALTGKTPALLIRSVRLAKAKELLQTTSMNVSEVAYEVGFTDPNYFSRVFSQEFGKPPSQFVSN